MEKHSSRPDDATSSHFLPNRSTMCYDWELTEKLSLLIIFMQFWVCNRMEEWATENIVFALPSEMTFQKLLKSFKWILKVAKFVTVHAFWKVWTVAKSITKIAIFESSVNISNKSPLSMFFSFFIFSHFGKVQSCSCSTALVTACWAVCLLQFSSPCLRGISQDKRQMLCLNTDLFNMVRFLLTLAKSTHI